MPNYTFQCCPDLGGCGLIIETFLLMSEYSQENFPKCPHCNQTTFIRRDFSADLPSGRVENQTLGSIADKNSSKLSKDEKIALWKKHNDYKLQPKTHKLPQGWTRMRKPTDLQPPKARRKRQVKK